MRARTDSLFTCCLLTLCFDDNQNDANARTTHTWYAQPSEEVLRGLETGPSNFHAGVKTTVMNRMANFAACLPSRLRNWLFSSQSSTTAIPTPLLAPPTRERQNPPSIYITRTALAILMGLAVLGLVAMVVLLVFTLVYKRSAGLMKKAWADTNESDELQPSKPAENTNRPKQSGKCVLPPYPEHGIYIITNSQASTPGDSYQSLKMTVICLPGYEVSGNATVLCYDGTWSQSIPKCVRFCKLDNHPSVQYHCLVSGAIKGSRACNSHEPSGTVVKPECNSPNYYSAVTLPYMRCVDGSWNYVAVCSPECGRVTPNGVNLVIDGRPAKRGELPWHVGIYRKTTTPYLQICGGSIINNRVVISAAHCFCNSVGNHHPASDYAVAAGKIYRPWNNPRDVYAQKSDVKEINTPVRYQGNAANFQDDIAILILVTPFVYHLTVRPICLDFDVKFDKRQLQPGKLGKVAGWGLTAENGAASQILKVVELPYVDIQQCIAASPENFREYITSDKMCAGYGSGKALCKGDSGGGLAFPESERGTDRYYLRGIVSTAATNDNLCNSHTLTTFTQILIHEHFAMEYL